MHCPWIHFCLLFMFVVSSRLFMFFVSSRLRSIDLLQKFRIGPVSWQGPTPDTAKIMVSLCLHWTSWRTLMEIFPTSVVSKRHRKLKGTPYLSPLLFSANYYDDFIFSYHLVLSAICIPIQWCPPDIQRSHKAFRLYRWRYKTPCRVIFGLLLFCQASFVVSLPGTNYALIQ